MNLSDAGKDIRNALKTPYSEERLLNLHNGHHIPSDQFICETAKRDVDAFSGKAAQFDDITMLCLRYHGMQQEQETAR